MTKDISLRETLLLFLTIVGIGLIVQAIPVQEISAEISCQGFAVYENGNLCNQSCSAEASEGENDYQWLWSAWRGSHRSWDDAASFTFGYSRINPSDSWSTSEFRTGTGDCGCGEANNCPGEDWPPAFVFFSSARAQLAGRDNVFGRVHAQNKHTQTPNPMAGSFAWDTSPIPCESHERTNDTYNGCVAITGNLNASPTSCNDPCTVNFNWNSNTRGSSNVTLGESSIASGGTSGSGSRVFSSPGSYTLSLNAQAGRGNMIQGLDSVTINVTSKSYDPSCYFSPSSVQVGQNATATATGGNGSYSWSALDGSPSSGSGSSFSVSYGTTGTKTVTVYSAGWHGQCRVTVTPSAPVPSGSISASPNPITGVCPPDTLGVTTLNVTNTVNAVIRVNSPTGTAMTGTIPPGSSSHTTGDWVSDGMWFYLVNTSNGSVLDSVQVGVNSSGCPSAPTVNLTANPGSILSGQSSTLSWSSTGATSCTASGDWSGGKATSGSQSTGALTSSKTYWLSCTGAGGTAADSASVTVGANPAPSVNLSASPSSVSSGGTSTLSWSVSNATSCTASGGWSGSKSASGGSQSVGPLYSSTTYTLSCTGPGGNASDSAIVTVSGPALTCSPAFTSGNIGQSINFGASGGNGGYTWSAPTAGITSGSGTFFTTYFNSAGNHTVTLSSSGDSTTCIASINTIASDLTITDFHLTDASGNTKTSFTPGERVYPSVTIRNNSSNPTQSSTGQFYVSIYSNRPSTVGVGTASDVNVWVTEYGNIAGGASKTYSVTQNSGQWSNQYWTMGSTGSFTARAFVDSFAYVTETNESNNQSTSGYTISNTSPAQLQVNPSSFSFSSNVGSNPANQTLIIQNIGGQNLSWSGSDDRTWISLGAGSGNVSAGSSQNVSVSINTAGMSAGNYSGTITITSNGGNTSIPVSLSIGSPCTTPGPGTNRLEGCVYQGTNLVSLHSNAPAGSTASTPADNFSAINMSWGTGGPNGLTDNFSVRWRGTFNFSGGNYEFTVNNPDDGFRVFVDSNQISPESEWTPQCCHGAHTYSVNGLSAGNHNITLEYYEQGGGANINLSWVQVASPPTLNFSASPSTINSGQSSTLTWSSTNATSCTASEGWSGSKAVSGSQAVTPASTTTYNLSCVGPGGTVNRSATVTVNVVNPDPDVTIRVNRVNGSSSFSLANIKDGDILQFAIDFRNGAGGGPATGLDSGEISLSNNLVNPTNFICPPVFSGTIGNFSVTSPIVPGGSAVTCTFDTTVQSTTTQQRELTTVGVTGNYNPGDVLYSDTFSLLITSDQSADPDFIEVPQN